MDIRAVEAAPQKTTATLTNPYGTYTVTVNESDLAITDMFDDVLIPLLQAAGYARETIEGVIGEPADPPTLEHLYRPDFTPPGTPWPPYGPVRTPVSDPITDTWFDRPTPPPPTTHIYGGTSYAPHNTHDDVHSESLERASWEEARRQAAERVAESQRGTCPVTAEANRIKPL